MLTYRVPGLQPRPNSVRLYVVACLTTLSGGDPDSMLQIKFLFHFREFSIDKFSLNGNHKQAM